MLLALGVSLEGEFQGGRVGCAPSVDFVHLLTLPLKLCV